MDRRWLAVALSAAIAAGCSSTPAPPIALSGTAEKAPLLDEFLEPTGRSFSTTTTDDLGSFALDVPAPRTGTPPIYLIEVEGLYYDEITDQVSDEPLRLRTLFQPAEGATSATVRVNLFTH